MGWRGFLLMMLMLGLMGIMVGCGDERAQVPATSTPPPATTSPTTPPATTPTQRTCPVCKQPVPVEAKYCRACGSRLP